MQYHKDRQLRGFDTPLSFKPEEDIVSVWFISAFGHLARFRALEGKLSLTDIIAYWNNVGRVGTLVEFIQVMSAIDNIEHKRNKK